MRKNGEPKYAHLAMELHVFIEVFAPVPEAYMRMAHAMEEIKKFLFPVSTPKSDSKNCSPEIIFCSELLILCFVSLRHVNEQCAFLTGHDG